MNVQSQISKQANLIPRFKKRKIYSITEKLESVEPIINNFIEAKNLVAIFQSSKDRMCKKTLIVTRNSYSISITDKKATIEEPDQSSSQTVCFDCPFDFLAQLKNGYSESIVHSDECQSNSFFNGGLVGYLGFGLVHSSLGIEKQQSKFIDIPDALLTIPGCFIEIDHLTKEAKFSSDKSLTECNSVLDKLSIPNKSTAQLVVSKFPNQTKSNSKEEFISKIETIKSHIKDGEAFQIVLSQRFSQPLPGKPIDLYKELRKESSSMYNYYFDFGSFQYAGLSPESCIQINQKKATFKALAGTRPRGKTRAEDQDFEAELLNCPKENAEHMMLVDLGRNDLGRISTTGSVKVKNLKNIVRNKSVMHLSSELESYIQDTSTVFDAIKSCFPRGTVSGAPKRRALSILAGLEKEQRGIYSGCIGFIDINDKVDLAIAIRGATIKNRIAHVQSGAGIVFDSDPELEYQETIHKANSILKPLEKLWR